MKPHICLQRPVHVQTPGTASSSLKGAVTKALKPSQKTLTGFFCCMGALQCERSSILLWHHSTYSARHLRYAPHTISYMYLQSARLLWGFTEPLQVMLQGGCQPQIFPAPCTSRDSIPTRCEPLQLHGHVHIAGSISLPARRSPSAT